MVQSTRFTLMERLDYKVDLEYNETFAILHLPSVSKFTKSVYLDMLSSIDRIEGFLESFGYQSLWLAIGVGDTTLAKLVNKLKFEYRGTAEGLDVYERKM